MKTYLSYIILAIIVALFGFFMMMRTSKAGAYYHQTCNQEWSATCLPSITIVPTIGVTPEVTPEASPSAIPTVEPTTPPAGQSDGQHSGPDGLGCAVHECKAATIPAGPPATGRAE